MSKSGFVFILTNRFMDNVAIIGYSYKNPEKLAYAISRATGIPADFHVSLVKKTKSPVDDYISIKSTLKNIIKEKNNIVMVECSPEKLLKLMKSEFGFSYRKNRMFSVFVFFVFIIAMFFLFSWYYNFLGLR